MSFQICIKTDKSLQQLATEIRNLFSLPPFRQNSFSGEPYCQFEMIGMLILIHRENPGSSVMPVEEEYLSEIQRFYRGRVVIGHDLEIY